MPGWSGSWSGFSARTRDTSAVMNDRVASVAALLHEAGETHHLVYRIVDGDDPDWASWYAPWPQWYAERIVGQLAA